MPANGRLCERFQEGRPQQPKHVQSETGYARGGMVPKPMFERSDPAYPVLRYPCSDACAALISCAPGYTPVTLINGSATEPCFVFVADEASLHRKLGLSENWG